MNDYELIYLVQNHRDGIALEFLFKKYELLIWKYIHMYDVPYYERDDFLQEGYLILHKAIIKFDESKNKTFTRYFELILKRRFWALIKKLPKHEIKEIPEIVGGYIIEEEVIIDMDLKSGLEKDVYEKYFLKGEKIKDIAIELKTSSKQIYNAIYRIKSKYKDKYK